MPNWITFDGLELSFKGNPPGSMSGKVLNLEIEFSDGLYTVVDRLSVKIEFSFAYLIEILKLLLGPLTAIAAIFRYRFILYLYFCKR